VIRSIHPFPARMAPDLAIAELKELGPEKVVLDPMAGSGTVVRQACELGHRAIGFDTDPLAVLMTRVWTTPVDDGLVDRMSAAVLEEARASRADDLSLPWIDDDEETRLFVDYWFSEPQRSDLRRITHALARLDRSRRGAAARAAADVLRLSLSRIIITKDLGASLARDVSHSRPHKVAESSNFAVMAAFDRSVRQVRRLLAAAPPPGKATVGLGDARSLRTLGNGSVDAVLTSPPYLNAIDYMRGHRLSLVWLGHRLSDLRRIRADSIGAERGPDAAHSAPLFGDIQDAMGPVSNLSDRHAAIVARYAEDIYRLMSEIARVIKLGGRAILVVGNSCLRGTFIRNSNGVVSAGAMVGLRVLKQVERDLPNRNRYLPMPLGAHEPLGKRMRTESILTFAAS
jgi:hypothetical protein